VLSLRLRCLAGSIAVAVLLLATGFAAAPRQALRATAAAPLDDKLTAAVARGDVPGLVAMAATRDRILYQGAFGKADVAEARPMTVDAIFRIASMTKAVT